MRSLCLMLTLWLTSCLARAMQNLTIDDTDPSIEYEPLEAWDADSLQVSSFDYHGSHTVSSNPDAVSTFTFVGVAVYYMSPLWPFSIGVVIDLDAEGSFPVDLQDYSRPTAPDDSPETVKSKPVWGATGLKNGSHQVTVSMGQDSQFVVVDAFMYTVLDHGNNNGTPASSSLSVEGSHNLAIVLGSAGAGLAIIAGVLVWMWVHRTRKNTIPSEVEKQSPPKTTPPPPPSPIMVTPINPLPTRSVGRPPRNSRGKRLPPPPPPLRNQRRYQPSPENFRSVTPPTCTSPAPSSVYTVPPDFNWQVPHSRDPAELAEWMRSPTRR